MIFERHQATTSCTSYLVPKYSQNVKVIKVTNRNFLNKETSSRTILAVPIFYCNLLRSRVINLGFK